MKRGGLVLLALLCALNIAAMGPPDLVPPTGPTGCNPNAAPGAACLAGSFPFPTVQAAPLTNPAGGAANYAPIDSPVLTSTASLVKNQNTSTIFSVNNNDPGTAAAISYQFNNGTVTDSFGLSGTGYAGSTQLPASTEYLYNAGAGGIAVWNNSSGPTNFFNGGGKVAALTTTGLDVLGLTIGGAALGGSCTNPQFVQTISASGVPTCATPSASAGAPTTNPAGGANNYAPLASPTFTGTLTAPTINASTTLSQGGAAVATLASPTFTGTVTAPTLVLTTTPLAITSGGTGEGTVPSAGQIPIGQGGGTYVPKPLGGAITMAATGTTTFSTSPSFTGTLTAPTIAATTALTLAGNPVATTTSGTFTPTMTSSGGALTGVTYQAQFGYWSIVGNLEYVSAYVSVSAWSGGSGNLIFTYTGAGAQCAQIGGAGAPQQTVAAVQFSGTNTLTAGYTWVSGLISGGSSNIGMYQNSGASDNNVITVPLSSVAQFVTLQASFTCRTS